MRSSETQNLSRGSGPSVARPRLFGAVVAAVEPLEQRQLLHAGHSDFHVQFAPARVAPVEGYVVDFGAAFAQNGEMSYGWSRRGQAKAAARRDTPLSPDARYDTFVNVKRASTWELAIPNGTYDVHLVAGDSKARRGAYGFDIEGVPALRGEINEAQRWVEATVSVTVADGMLTLTTPPEYKRSKINFLDVIHVGDPPGDGTGGTPTPTPEPTPTPVPTPTPTPPPTPGTPTGILGAWRAGAPSPIARAEAIGAAVGGKLYVFGGIDGRGSNYAFPVTTRADAYDVAADTWTRLRDMPEPLTHSVGTVDGTTIWFVGGFVGDTPAPGTTHVWKYDTLTDTWARGPDLPEARGGGASAIAGRTLHYFGGANQTRTADMPTHWSLNLDDPAATWVRKADMILARNHMAAATVDGKIYAVGGQRGELDEAVDLAEVDVYDPATDIWTAVPPMPTARSHTNCSTLVLNGKLLVVGGESGKEMYEPTILSYDPATAAWTVAAVLPGPRSTAIAGFVNSQLVLSTGNAPSISTETYVAPLVV